MAVAPASMADKIIDLDDEEESPQPSCSASTSSSQPQAKKVLPRAQQPAPTHITQSPFASAKKDRHVLQAENQRLFAEFVEHCSTLTQDCPEVLTFLQTKHTKASPEFLSSVEFRNTLGRCLTHAQANRSKAFVYINELCTALRQHSAKRRQALSKPEPRPSTSTTSVQLTSESLKREESKDKKHKEDGEGKVEEENQSSTSGQQKVNNEKMQEDEKKAKRASRKQIAYLENLLKVYNDEICRLQQAELDLDDLGAEDSLYIQEHKLKRKMMKIYEKLCELKNCSTLTGRVIEQRIRYNSTRYPEINKKIERFINSPEAHRNPPDYHDILQLVLRANERYKLCLARKQLNQIAQEAFRETGSSLQERRHLDLVYNFGSRLTDVYKPAKDPALTDSSLLRKLRSNRESGRKRLEEVINKYAVKQEDTEEQERAKRLEKDRKEKEAHKSENGEKNKEVNGVAEGEEEAEEEQEEEVEDDDDDDEDDESSDPDIEEEIQASTEQDGPDNDDNEDGDSNNGEQACDASNKDDQMAGSVSAEEEGSVKEEDEEPASGVSPLSEESKSQISPLSDLPSPRQSPSQSEPIQTNDQTPLSNGNHAALEEPVDSSSQLAVVLISPSTLTKDPADVSLAANGVSVPLSPTIIVENCDTQTNTNGSIRTTRSHKRKREEVTSGNSPNSKHIIIYDSEVDIPLDMGVFSCNSPQRAESSRADTPTHEVVSSSQSTPPPKKNKVNVATQCDPDEVIILSDSE